MRMMNVKMGDEECDVSEKMEISQGVRIICLSCRSALSTLEVNEDNYPIILNELRKTFNGELRSVAITKDSARTTVPLWNINLTWNIEDETEIEDMEGIPQRIKDDINAKIASMGFTVVENSFQWIQIFLPTKSREVINFVMKPKPEEED